MLTLEAIKKRVKNYGFWVSIIALIPMVCQVLGITSLPKDYAASCNAVLAFLVAAGILSDPTTDNKGFLDDPTKDEAKDAQQANPVEKAVDDTKATTPVEGEKATTDSDVAPKE